MREDLIAVGEPRQVAAQEKGLAELKLKGGAGSRRKWWAFEGFTEVDCALVTDRLLLFIEGKRTESVASSTDWYPRRTQLVRNLEAVRKFADDRSAAVLLVAETPVAGEMSEDVVVASLPHLNATERAGAVAGYLRQTTWEQLGKAIGHVLRVPLQPLPETKHDALSQLKLQGRVIRRT